MTVANVIETALVNQASCRVRFFGIECDDRPKRAVRRAYIVWGTHRQSVSSAERLAVRLSCVTAAADNT